MMNDFIAELRTDKDLMKVALTLKMMRTMTQEEYDKVSSTLPPERGTQLVYTLYGILARNPKTSDQIKSVLTRLAGVGELVKRWDDTGKHLYFLAEPLFMSCALFVNLVREKKRALQHQKQVRFSPRAPASGVAGRRMLANVSQNSSNRGFHDI